MPKNGFRPMSRKSYFTIKCYAFITFLNRDFCTGFRLGVEWTVGSLGVSRLRFSVGKKNNLVKSVIFLGQTQIV